jgi:hypothetical protein
MNDFKVSWAYACHVCQRPLNVSVKGWSVDYLLLKLTVYTELNPLNFTTNKREFRFFNGEKKARSVCHHCRVTKINYALELRKRETGIRCVIEPRRNPTKTADEIVGWFSMLAAFFNRPDFLEYIPNGFTYRIKMLGNLVIRDDDFEIFFSHH